MRRKYLIYSTALAVFALAGTGCKKFLDVNKNVNSPTPSSVSLSLVLSSCERSIGGSFSLGSGLGNTFSVYTHQMTGRVGADRYGAGASSWEALYAAISNLDVIIERGTTENRLAYVGIAKILKAYTYSMMVDIWGDIPFSEVNKFPEIKQPKFDKGSDIYPKLLTMIDEGIADINNPIVNPSKPGSDDYIYKGDLTKWKKAANTIKLKLYTQIRLVQDVKAQVTALLATPANLISSAADNFMLPFGPNGTTDDRHPGYGDYNATQRGGQLFSPWLYEIMKGRNQNIFTNLNDPRIPYYIYNQKTATGAPENCTEFRDGGFITIIFGSNGNCRDGSNSSTYSLFGVFPVGGRYDAGAGVTITSVGPGNAGTGARPHEFITYADRLYLEAELINEGVVTGNVTTAFTAALNETFAHVDNIVQNFVKPSTAGAGQTVPAIATLAATTTYKNGVLSQFAAGTAAKKLEIIMTSKWINRIENAIDNYTDYRRTKYPVLFAPAPEGTVTSVSDYSTPTPKITPVSNDRKYPWTLPFSQGEINLNKNAPPQKVPESFKPFWQP
jgi:hypothetical protein